MRIKILCIRNLLYPKSFVSVPLYITLRFCVLEPDVKNRRSASSSGGYSTARPWPRTRTRTRSGTRTHAGNTGNDRSNLLHNYLCVRVSSEGKFEFFFVSYSMISDIPNNPIIFIHVFNIIIIVIIILLINLIILIILISTNKHINHLYHGNYHTNHPYRTNHIILIIHIMLIIILIILIVLIISY